jgi:hypothetical protein
MPSVREQIVTRIAALLNGPNSPATAYRSRTEALTSQESLPAFAVYWFKERPNDDLSSHDRVGKTLTVRVECIVKGPTPADTLADPLLVYAVKQVMTDVTLDGLTVEITEAGIQVALESEFEDIAAAALDFDVDYTHLYGDATAA